MKTTEPPIVFQSDKQLVHMKKHKIIISAVVGILVVIVLLVLAWFFAPKLLGKHGSMSVSLRKSRHQSKDPVPWIPDAFQMRGLCRR